MPEYGLLITPLSAVYCTDIGGTVEVAIDEKVSMCMVYFGARVGFAI